MKGTKSAAVFGAILVLGIVTYATTIEPYRITLTGTPVQNGSLAATLAHRKAALISDLHFGDDGDPLTEPLLGQLGAIQPDLILLAGDFVQWGSGRKAYERAFDFLAKLRAPLGVYAVLGDADVTDSRASCEFCHEAGSGAPTSRHRVVFLRNDSRTIRLPAGELRIVGLDTSLTRPTASLVRRLLAGGAPTILLSHSSVVYRDIDPAMDVLTVSGDTHGGQIMLPKWVWRLTRLKPDPDHIHGFFQDGRKSLVVTRGVGTSRLRFRLGVPPEIVILEFGGKR
jgi:hypothetical protein